MFSFSGVSQDLNEVIMTMVNNAAVILAKARQQPSSGMPPTTPQPPASNPGAITPNPLSAAAGGALNVAPPGPGSNTMPSISTPGLGANASSMPTISTPNMGINSIASNFGNIGGSAGPIGGVGPLGGVGPIGGGPSTIGGGPLGGGGGPIGGGSSAIGGTPISTSSGGVGGGIGTIGGALGANSIGSTASSARGVKPGPLGMPAVMQGLQNNPLGNPAAVGVSSFFNIL